MTEDGTAHVLVVDDSEAMRYATVRVLRRAGFIVDEAADGTEALRQVAAGGIDAVVLDVKLPDISGLDVCRQIKRDYPAVMVLQLSATFVTSGDRVKGLDSGADAYLGQPVEAAELLATLGALLRIRAAESALRDSEARFRVIAETMPQIVWSARDDGVCDYFNGRWYDFTGRSATEPGTAEGGEGWFQRLHADDRALAEACWAHALATGESFEIEGRLRAADATHRWFLARALPVRDDAGKLVRWLGTCTDIEDIVAAREVLALSRAELEAMVAARAREIGEANERLRQQRAFSELLVACSVDGLLAYDAELRYTLWNQAMERISGVPASTALGQVATDLFPFVRGRPEQAMRRALAGETARVTDERYTVPETGREGWYEADFTPMRAPDGQIIGAIAFIRDTTERRVVEEQLRQAQKVEALGHLTSGVAHDFNNLLAAILANLELLRKRLPPAEAALLRFVDHAMQGAERGAALTQRLLAFARRQDLKPDAVDIAMLLNSMRDLIQRSVGPTVVVCIEAPQDLWPARVDANQLELAILNLAVNARDAMPMGGTLTVTAVNHVLKAGGDASLPPGDYVRVGVADSGVGMDEATLARAIDPFFTTKEPGKGTGLGLSMVHGLAAQSGGRPIVAEPARRRDDRRSSAAAGDAADDSGDGGE